MSELPPPEPTFPAPPKRSAWTLLGPVASAALHVGVLVLLLWQPPPDSVNAAPPSAIDVVLVPPPEPDSASEPPADETPEEEPAEEEPAEEAAAAAAAETSPPETTTEPAAPEDAPEAAASQPNEPVQGAGTASARVAPIPLARPAVRGLTAPQSGAQDTLAVTADTGAPAEATAPPAPAAELDVATLELGAQQSAERFYFKAMMDAPSMARVRDTLETLPPEKRLAQTCILEALAQIGNSGQGFAPDVVMAEAYAGAELTGTRLAANGAIFRSGDNWYGLAFDCTLSDDLSDVTAFSYRLGADVTEAVLARLNGG